MNERNNTHNTLYVLAEDLNDEDGKVGKKDATIMTSAENVAQFAQWHLISYSPLILVDQDTQQLRSLVPFS